MAAATKFSRATEWTSPEVNTTFSFGANQYSEHAGYGFVNGFIHNCNSGGYGMHSGGQGCMINMDAFSDCSDSDSEGEESRTRILEELSKGKSTKECRHEDASDTRSVSEPDAEATPEGMSSPCALSVQEPMYFGWQESIEWMQAQSAETDFNSWSGCSDRRWSPSADAEEWTPSPSRHSDFVPWPETAEVAPLEVSDNSWIARQRSRRNSCASEEELSDAEIVRSMKAILNKLTIERFASLYQQLLQCGIHTVNHVELLIEELFEKATTQHHFIGMYSDLCSKLHAHFAEQKNEDIATNFRKVLLRACQHSFEKNLTPPENLGSLAAEERVLVEVKYKTRMLGNIKFVGALLTRKMLAGKVFLALADELLASPTPEALETLAALLTAVGSTFDHPTWPFHVAFNAIFSRVEALSQQGAVPKRVRCLLADVLDLRAAQWQCSRPKKLEDPTTLAEVAQKRAQEEGLSTIAFLIEDAQRKAQKRVSTAPDLREQQANFRHQLKRLLSGLTEEQADGCMIQLLEFNVPHDEQPTEMSHLLTECIKQTSQHVRQAGFTLAAALMLRGCWDSVALGAGLDAILTEATAKNSTELDAILKNELHPKLQPMVGRGLLDASKHAELLRGLDDA